MRSGWYTTPPGFWQGPALLGVALILAGIVIWVYPRLLAAFVALMFIMIGATMLGLAWKMRGRVSYHRMDQRDDRFDQP